jgi:hypothetical protein
MSTSPAEWAEFSETVKANARSHAEYFWTSDRQVEELGVVRSLHESLEKCGSAFFRSFESRGENNDPPDCEAMSFEGERIGIEVTELVDKGSIRASKRNQSIPFEPWTKSQLYNCLRTRIEKKGQTSEVKGGPYNQYILIIFCDEPRVLDYGLIEYVRSCEFEAAKLLDKVFFLMSYSGWEKCCPFIELKLKKG